MKLESRFCLICDDVAIIEVISVQMQAAPLCGVHWADYCSNDASLTADEVRKFFDDGQHGDGPREIQYQVARSRDLLNTDETPGEYRTGEQESG